MKATTVFKHNWDAIHQLDSHGLRKYRYLINSGSSRSSKTYSIIQLFYLYAISNPNKKLSVFRDTKQICKQTVFEDMKKVYIEMPTNKDVTLNITESIFKFANGSSIHIEGTDDPVKIHGYHCDVLWINEGYNISKDTFDQLDMRCKDFVLLDLNPRQSHWSEDVEKSANAIKIHSTFRNNPFVPEEQKKKILSYQPVVKFSLVESKVFTEKQAREYDILNNTLGLTENQLRELTRCRENESTNTANLFNWQVYAQGEKAERPNRIFHWEPIPYEVYKIIEAKTYVATDWGTVDPWGIVEAKYYDGALYLHELNYSSENEIRQRLTITEQAQINADNEGMVTWMFNKLGIEKNTPIICDTNRPLKIAALRRAGWSFATPASKPQGSVNDGIDLLNNIRVYYTSCSKNIEYEQENYSWKVDRYGIVLEEPEDINNHVASDPGRYIAQYLQSIGIIKRV